MAQGVANHALSGEAVVSSTVAATAFPLFDWKQRDEKKLAERGVRVDQMPRIGPTRVPTAIMATARRSRKARKVPWILPKSGKATRQQRVAATTRT